MRKFLASAAVLALLSAPALAEQGKGNGGGNGGGNDNGGGKGAKAQVERGGGAKPGKADRGPDMRGPEMRGNDMRGNDRAERGPKVRGNERAERMAVDTRGNGRGNADRDDKGKPDRMTERFERDSDRRRDDRFVEVRDRDDRVDIVQRARFAPSRGLIDGCPPGLAKKNNGCMPPGQLREGSESWRRPQWLGYGDLDDNYRYYDGYMLRLAPDNRVLGYMPLLGGALALGNPWPQAYQPVAVSPYYQNFFDLGPADNYRYYDDTIYRVDPESDAISAVAALLTGDDITVGQPLPLGYDIYNVPMDYRDEYADGPDSIYRYSDGYVYQADPTTRLVQAVIELLV